MHFAEHSNAKPGYQVVKSAGENNQFPYTVILVGNNPVGRLVAEGWKNEINEAFATVKEQAATINALRDELTVALGNCLARGHMLGASAAVERKLIERWQELTGCEWSPAPVFSMSGTFVICQKCNHPYAVESLPGVVSCTKCLTLSYLPEVPPDEK